jgi:hypothetical protein
MHYIIIARMLSTMEVGQAQQKFLQGLLMDWLAVRGRFNFVNLSRHMPWHERTLRRWFNCAFDWSRFNGLMMESLIPPEHEAIAVLDASYIPKSGKETTGLGYFFSGCAGRVLKGLELSLVSVVDVQANTAYALDGRQTLPGACRGKKMVRQSRKPARGGDRKVDRKGRGATPDEETRIDAYVEQVRRVRALLPRQVRYLAVDGYYTRHKFVEGVCATGLDVIGKLRGDAAMKYLLTASEVAACPKRRGRPRRFGDKVRWTQLDWQSWRDEGRLDKDTSLYSAQLYHNTLKRVLSVALLRHARGGKTSDALLFSTDVDLSAADIVRYYKARFQIEFLFRDAKQGAGLTHCQSRSAQAMHFHWNAALCAVNLAKWQEARQATLRTFSVASFKQRRANERLLK